MESEDELLPSVPAVLVDESSPGAFAELANEKARLESRRALLQRELERLQAPVLQQSPYYRERRACCLRMLEIIDVSIAQLDSGMHAPAALNAELETLFQSLHID
jgi:hypothetical protein